MVPPLKKYRNNSNPEEKMKLYAPSTIREIKEKHGFRLSKSLGQNFLTDKNIIDEIVASAQINPNDLVVEIGPGIGVITTEAAKYAKKVIAVEIDKNLIPILPPIEIAGMLARRKAKAEHPELRDEDIGTVFISPCPAKVSYVKNALCGEKSNVDCVVSVSDMYFELLDTMKNATSPLPVSRTGMIGVNWATSGGESSSLLNDRYLAADGIENVIKVLDEIETGSYPCLDFIELNACPGGCVGGVLAMENPYIARVRLQNIRRYLPVSQNRPPKSDDGKIIPEQYGIGELPAVNPVSKFSSDRKTAMRLMAEVARVFESLPEIDCGYCGAPTCRAFAEDVVKGQASCDECVVRMREKMRKEYGDNK